MWKILVAFILFAAIALTAVFQMGDKANMQGESGGHESSEIEHKADIATKAPVAGEAEKK